MKQASPLAVPEAFAFLRALAENNDRAWFERHRPDYESCKAQFEDFVAGLLIAAIPLDKRFAHVEPRRCIFRIFRDVRFARDKTPYKTRFSAFLSPLGWRGTTPGYYVALEPGGESLFAAGIYTPPKAMLADLRARVAHGDPLFERLLRRKAFAPYLPLDTDPLARMPRGFARDHPRGELLRARRYMVRRPLRDAELTDGDAFALIRTAMRDTAPFVTWLGASSERQFEAFDPGFE